MKVTYFTREALAVRREIRRRRAEGWERIEGPWDIQCGARNRQRITACDVARDGKHVWIRLADPGTGGSQGETLDA